MAGMPAIEEAEANTGGWRLTLAAATLEMTARRREHVAIVITRRSLGTEV
jgi:hypothetical protein